MANKKVVSITVAGKTLDPESSGGKALIALVGGRNAGKTNVQAWQDVSASGFASYADPVAVVCVLKDGKPFRQMTVANIAKGVSLLPELKESIATTKRLSQALSKLQTHFVTPLDDSNDPAAIANDLAQFMAVPGTGKQTAK